jgi:pyruvate formate-lyase activating enzyme-like uncharacterized protein
MSPDNIFNTQIKLTDSTGEQFTYKPMAILVISRYSNIMTVVKREADNYITYNNHLYTDILPLSKSKLSDLLDTSMCIMAFYSRVSNRIYYYNLTFK